MVRSKSCRRPADVVVRAPAVRWGLPLSFVQERTNRVITRQPKARGIAIWYTSFRRQPQDDELLPLTAK